MFKKFKAFEAPYRYNFKDPDTDMSFVSSSREDLFKQIITYRQQNRLEPIEALPLVVENYWCSQPENIGKCQDNPDATRSFTAYLSGGMMLLKSLLFKRYAPQEVADKRAEQCVSCEFNVFPDKGPFIKWTDDLAIECVGQRKSKYHNELGQCGVCTCALRAKVFIDDKLPPFDKQQLVQLRKVKCWQLPLSGQDK